MRPAHRIAVKFFCYLWMLLPEFGKICSSFKLEVGYNLPDQVPKVAKHQLQIFQLEGQRLQHEMPVQHTSLSCVADLFGLVIMN
jgi:hypothetical protein